MSATPLDVRAPAASGAAASGRPGAWRRHRGTLLIVLGLLAAVAVVLSSGQGARTYERLDPANPGPDGAQAVARVLVDQDVEVSVVRGADAFDRADVAGGTTVVVTSTDSLGSSTWERLREHAAAARVVLVDPGAGLVAAGSLGPPPSSTRLGEGQDAACADPTYDGLRLEVDDATSYAGEGCFGADGQAVLLERDGLVLFGAGGALTNDQVLRADNAAVALRLLGEDPRLVWYVPSVEDLVADDGVSVSSLLPDWVGPGAWLVGLATGALVLWRVRRLGPLATEPLPVVVKAIETTHSRGRLYRRAGDRGHAAAALRRAARTRAADHLGLGRSPDDAAVVRDVARHLGRGVAEVDALLGPHAPAPSSDTALITLADDLAELDREVRRP